MNQTAGRALLVIVLFSAMTLIWWTALPDSEPDGQPDLGWVVTEVVDGDTIRVSRGGVDETVRFIGIDTPERDQCGYQEASDYLESIIGGQNVALVDGATTDRDSYDRLLRYVEYGGYDVGLAQIAEGYAIARYDSRTGQPHPREDVYREADDGTVHICDGA